MKKEELEQLKRVKENIIDSLKGASDKSFSKLIISLDILHDLICMFEQKEVIEDEVKEEIKEEKNDKKEERLTSLEYNYNVFAKYKDTEKNIPIFRNNNLQEVVSFLEKEKDIFEKMYHDFFIVDTWGITRTEWSAYSFSDFIDNLKIFIKKLYRIKNMIEEN